MEAVVWRYPDQDVSNTPVSLPWEFTLFGLLRVQTRATKSEKSINQKTNTKNKLVLEETVTSNCNSIMDKRKNPLNVVPFLHGNIS